MNSITKRLVTAGLVLLTLLGTALAKAEGFEVRVAPSDLIYVNENNRRIGIYDIMVQTIAIVNRSASSLKLREILIEALKEGNVILTDRLTVSNYQAVWDAIYPNYSDPKVQAAHDTITLYSLAVPEGVTISPKLTLEPSTAILVRNRLLAFSGYILPDKVRVTTRAVDPEGKVITAESSLPVVRFQNKNVYIFPVTGRWYLSSSSSIRSHHRARVAHEFALDIMKIGAGGKSFKTDGATPADYYAFGQKVIAIADGTIIDAEASIAETEMPKPGEARKDFAKRVLGAMWKKDPSGRVAGGNYVVIKHDHNEYSVYVHLRHGSVKVKAGDRVRQGQAIGQVGISGDGFEPHLHFSVTDTPDMNYGHGLPVTFTNVKPVGFSSTLDVNPKRLFLSGEFVDTLAPGKSTDKLDVSKQH